MEYEMYRAEGVESWQAASWPWPALWMATEGVLYLKDTIGIGLTGFYAVVHSMLLGVYIFFSDCTCTILGIVSFF
jgi:hypothetical protein